jgi:hypothetical protein
MRGERYVIVIVSGVRRSRGAFPIHRLELSAVRDLGHNHPFYEEFKSFLMPMVLREQDSWR